MTDKDDKKFLKDQQEQFDMLKELCEWDEIHKGLGDAIEYSKKHGDLKQIKSYFNERVAKKYQEDYDSTNLAFEIRAWVEKDATGIFTVRDVYESLNLSKDQHRYVSRVLSRIDNVCPTKRRPGEYRLSSSEMTKVEWLGASSAPMKILLPMDIHKHAEIYPSNIILIAGTYNAGKSAFCLSTALMNMDRYQIDYYTCEMDKHEFSKRVDIMDLSEERKQEFYDRVNVWERSYDFDDVINPDGFSIIDYLTAPASSSYEIKDYMERIHNKLLEGKGVCLIAQHKKHNSDHAYGGERAYDRPRLVIAIESGVAKFIKVKNWATEDNPNGKFINYTLHNGYKFSGDTWRTEDAEETYQDSRRKKWD